MSTNTKDEAERIANLFYNQENLKNKIDAAKNSLLEAIYELSGDIHVTFQPFYEYRGLLIDVACLLTNPKISGQLQDNFNKENAGRLLRELLFFFDKISTDEDLQSFLTWHNLQHFWGSLSKNQIYELEATMIRPKSTNH